MKGKQKGGVLFTSEPDIMPELVRFTEGNLHVLAYKDEAIIVELTASPSTVLTNPCAISSVLLKIMAIEKNATFNRLHIGATPLKEFKDEVHHHQDIGTRSVEKFGCSIVPSILYADVYTHAELMKVFPALGQHVRGTVGIIFMERITHDPRLETPTLLEYARHVRDDTLLPKARRLFVMLAQLGFLHNDFHLNNIVVTKPYHGSSPALLLIDFGRSSAIDPTSFNALVEAYDASKDDALKEQILTFLYRIEYEGYDPDDYPENYGWFKGNIADEVEVTAPLALDEIQKTHCVAFSKLDYETRELLKRNGQLLKDYPALQTNRTYVLFAVANFGEALEYADPALRGDKEVVMTAVLQNGMALRYASPEMRADRDVLRIALRDLRALPYAIRPEKEFIMNFIRRDGLSLVYLPGIRDKEIIMAAVRQNGLALHYVDKEVQDVDMVMAAVSQNGLALKDASEAMKAMEVVMAAVSQNGMALEHASAFMKAMEEVVMAAVRQNGMALQYASATLRKDEQVVLMAVLQNGRAIQFTTLKRNPKIILYASVNGHRATEDEIKHVLPFLDTYVPSEEDKELMTFTHVPKMAKKMSTVETFRTLYEREIRDERRRLEAIQERMSESLERLSDCRKGNCNIQGGKNKRVMYGTRRKSHCVRSKSRRT